MSLKRESHCVQALGNNLAELKRRSDLESLRPYLIAEQCFSPHATDLETHTITLEDLKKLARAWKLHERRNFWKLNSTLDLMVASLLDYIHENGKHMESKIHLETKETPKLYAPSPPSTAKPSRRAGSMKNYCGMKYYFREIPSAEMLTKSRFFDFPDPETAIPSTVNKWRSEDFNMRINDASTVKQVVTTKALTDKSKLGKHRNLAAHLARFSFAIDSKKPALNGKSVQTFVSVAETDDQETASYCMIAISNISSSALVRAIMLEINAVHKMTTLIPQLRGAEPSWAADLLFYYFSCEADIEDRIYNSCISLLQSCATTDDDKTRMLCLYTLNNLMPCLDRIRVAELIMNVLFNQVVGPPATDDAKISEMRPPSVPSKTLLIYMEILLNVCAFTNTHLALLGQDILELIANIVNIALEEQNAVLGLVCAKILMSLLQLDASLQPVIQDYICIVIDLLNLEDVNVLRYLMRSLAILSANNALIEFVCETDVIAAVTRIIDSRKDTPMDICKDEAKYLANICRPTSKEFMRRLVADSVPVTILQLIQICKKDKGVQCIAVRGIQNILSYRENAMDLAAICFLPLLRIMKEMGDAGAALTVYNISCVIECEAAMMAENVHMKILQFMTTTTDHDTKSAYLRVLVQLSGNATCIDQMLTGNLIGILANEVTITDNFSVWLNVAKMLLAVVAYRTSLTEPDRQGIVRILKRICTKVADERVIAECCTVLAFLSLTMSDFSEIDDVMRAVLTLSNSEEVMEAASYVLYNVSCSEENNSMLLRDGLYLNIMIKMMRSGKPLVQQNITEAISSLCSDNRCAELLLKMDLLSDLIVIALLRTSSEDINIVCNNAFYNMLCHENTRLKLLKGDLWWAVMRLCRTDSEAIRRTFARALFDLSCDDVNIVPLRDHHILSFVRDVTMTGSVEFLDLCLSCIRNITSRFGGPYNHHEVTSTVRICMDTLSRIKSIESIRTAVALMLQCAQQLPHETVTEAIQMDFDRVFTTSAVLWSKDETCRANVTRLLWGMSKSRLFTKGMPLTDLSEILLASYSAYPSAESAEDIAGMIQQYVIREQPAPSVLLGMPVWDHIICDTLGVPRNVADAMQTMAVDTPVYGPYPMNARAIVLSVYCYLLPAATAAPENITPSFVHGLLTTELISSKLTRNNLLMVINAFAMVPELSMHLLQSNLLSLLAQLLVISRKTSQTLSDKATLFCASMLSNLSLHKSILPRLVATPNNGIDKLLSDIVEQGLEAACKDISVMFYNTVVHYMLKPEFSLNSDTVLVLVESMERIVRDEDVIRINKFVIGVVLKKFSYGRSVDPSFVQDQFNEMQINSAARVPGYMAKITLKMMESAIMDCLDILRDKPTVAVDIKPLPPAETMWQPILVRVRKRMDSVMDRLAVAEPSLHLTLENSEPFPAPAFQKVIKEYSKVAIDSSVFSSDDNSFLEFPEDEEEQQQREQEEYAQLVAGLLSGESGPSLAGAGIAVMEGSVVGGEGETFSVEELKTS